MDTAAVVGRLSAFFSESQRRFAAIGGYGLLAHGIQRATFDLDLVVEKEAQDELIAFLEAMGYDTLHRSSGYSNHLHRDADLGRLDFVYVDRETAESLFAGCSRMEILSGITVPVPRPEHLAAMKVQAIKNDPTRKLQDLADIRLLARLPGVDRDEIREYFDRVGLAELYEEIENDD